MYPQCYSAQLYVVVPLQQKSQELWVMEHFKQAVTCPYNELAERMHKHGFDDSVVPFSKTSYWHSDSFSNSIYPYFNHLCSHICPVAHRLNCSCNLSQISLLTSSNIHVTRGKVSCPIRTEIWIRTVNGDWDSNSHPFQITSFFFFFEGKTTMEMTSLLPPTAVAPPLKTCFIMFRLSLVVSRALRLFFRNSSISGE